MKDLEKYFYASQIRWIEDESPLKIAVKSRQVGFSFANALRLVLQVSADDARLDAYISSRDQLQAKLQLDDCRNWARVFNIGCSDNGEILLDEQSKSSAYVLQFANGRRIYSLSSNPNALAGKRGHVVLDEFALHPDQRLLFRVAKPATMWGGQFSIISTQRGAATFFNQIILRIKNTSSGTLSETLSETLSSSDIAPISESTDASRITHHEDSPIENNSAFSIQPLSFGSSWSLHEVPIEKAVAEGLVERINKKTGRNESREHFLARLEAECADRETWLQEYRCIPADENAAFFSYEMLDACTDRNLKLLSFESFLSHLFPSSHSSHSSGSSTLDIGHWTLDSRSSLYAGVDIARTNTLCVIDVGEKRDSVITDVLRLEIHNQSFTEIENQLFPILALPQVKRACIDDTGMGQHLAERARERFGWKVEPIRFTAPKKEELAFALRRDFEDRIVRIPNDDALRADLHALKKEITPTGKLHFIGEVENSHCDRTWAKALRQHSARKRTSAGCIII